MVSRGKALLKEVANVNVKGDGGNTFFAYFDIILCGSVDRTRVDLESVKFC